MMELLVVIAVIAILVSILLPALMGVQRSAKEAAAVAEITQIKQAIANFKATFGVEPPSHITLYVNQAGWDGDPEAMATIRRLWPNFDFGNTSYGWASPVHLSGAECLCFFLGGIQDPGWFTTGFSKDPGHPFNSQVGGDSRDGPFLEMKSGPFFPTSVLGVMSQGGRLVDRDGDGMLEFCDIFNTGMPYIYASGREGKGYVATDVIVFTDTGIPAANDMTRVYSQNGSTAGINSAGYQIISAGVDGDYGLGGPWDASSSWATIVNGDSSVIPADKAKTIQARRLESDNITNFHNKRLK